MKWDLEDRRTRIDSFRCLGIGLKISVPVRASVNHDEEFLGEMAATGQENRRFPGTGNLDSMYFIIIGPFALIVRWGADPLASFFRSFGTISGGG